jgi:predicted nucleotidyltransferase
MRPSEALNLHRMQIREIALRHRVSGVRVFGSVLRGDDLESSDLDLLVDPTPGMTLFDLGGLQDDLQQLMGIPVEVVTPNDLPASFRARVLEEARWL